MLDRWYLSLALVTMPLAAQVVELPPPPAIEPRPLVWGQTFEPLTTGEKAYFHYVRRTVGPWGLMMAGYASALDAVQDDPIEWDGRKDAYARRFAARMGTRLTRSSIAFGIAQFTHEDPRFFRTGATGFGPRVKGVLMQTVRTRKDDGGVIFPYGRVVGAFAAAQISQAWYPASRDGFGENFRRGGLFLAGDLGTRMLREFWPDIRGKLRLKRSSAPKD